MSTTRDNHYVPQWHQNGFTEERDNELRHIKRKVINLPNGTIKTIESRKWYTSAQALYQKDLYTTFFGTEVNDAIEKKLFGPIDDNGSAAIRAFLADDQAQWHHNFQDLFTYLDVQKLRTPKGLDWIKSKYPSLDQIQLMTEMQGLRTIHCTLWTEGVRELVSAKDSNVKFIVSDHPVTVYNYACSPESELCKYPNEPDIALKGTQTIFPLDKNRCLILTNLEYAEAPNDVDPLEQRTNATRVRPSMVNTIKFINSRRLNADEVTKINHIIKSRARDSVAAGSEEWLYPESSIDCDWAELRHTLLPPSNELHEFGGEMFAQYEDGTTHYQDAFGRTTPGHSFLDKGTDESTLGRNSACGCGSGKKYKGCCRNISADKRTTWAVASIRERNLAFCNCIRDVLNLSQGKTWNDVRRELSNEQISKIYSFYELLWPRETDIYSLLPKSDGKFRALYSGALDTRVLGIHALPMASHFDEFLIQSPIVNPNNVNPEFSPTKSPDQYKYQAVKDFSLMLELEPYIGHGLINLIPDPSNFDLHLMREGMKMARDRSDNAGFVSRRDKQLLFRLGIEDLLNSIHMMPRDVKIQTVMHEYGVPEKQAAELIDALEANAEASPLTMLQSGEDGQIIQFSIGPNYEMAMFIAQVTGSVIVTDSETRWVELQAAQHRVRGVTSYPWSDIHEAINTVPMDYQTVETLKKSQGEFSTFRSLLNSADELVLASDTDPSKINQLSTQIRDSIDRVDTETTVTAGISILVPDGGFRDLNVQRLLVSSSSPSYDDSVRSVYYVNLEP